MTKVHVVSAEIVPRLRLTLIASAPIAAGEVIVQSSEEQLESERTWRTVQMGRSHHLNNEFLDFVDHSCAPNSIPDTDRLALVALRSIEPGEPITFFYPGSEVELAQSFECRCGADECIGTIGGGFYLTPKKIRWALERGYCTTFMTGEFERLFELNPVGQT